MKILKLHGSLSNLGGIVAFQRSLQGLNARSKNYYFHFRTGRDAKSRLQSFFLFRYFFLAFSYIYFPVYLLCLRPDVIEINSSLVPRSFLRDYWYARISSIVCPSARLVLFNHGWDEAVKLKLLKENKERLLRFFGFFDCIIVLAGSIFREVEALDVGAKVEVITTGIDLEEFEGISDRGSSEIRRILFLSRLEKEKGIGELLDAVPALIARYPHLEVCIAGTGSYEGAARAHPAVSSCSDNIRFCGYVRGHEKRALLASADLFIFPSYSEGCPVSVLEALAVGLPIIYTPVGALPDFLESGRNGLQMHSGKWKEIVETITDLMDNRELINAMSNNNRRLSKRFDLEVIHKKLEGIYEDHG